MANVQNLKHFGAGREDTVECAKKGNAASTAAKRRKKLTNQIAKEMLAMAVKDPKMTAVLDEIGLDKNSQTYQAAVVAGMITAAAGGNERAARWLWQLAGIDPVFDLEKKKFAMEKEKAKEADSGSVSVSMDIPNEVLG